MVPQHNEMMRAYVAEAAEAADVTLKSGLWPESSAAYPHNTGGQLVSMVLGAKFKRSGES